MTNTDSTAPAYHHGDLPSALLDAVGQIIEEQGAGAVSLREAARRAGVSHSAPAHHFGDKLGLLAGYAQQGFEIFAAEMSEAIEGAGEDPTDRLKAAGMSYVRFGLRHQSHFEVMFRLGPQKDQYPECMAASERAFGLLAACIADLVAAGQFPGVDPGILAAYFWSVAHGLTALWVDGSMPHFYGDADIDQIADQVLEMSMQRGA